MKTTNHALMGRLTLAGLSACVSGLLCWPAPAQAGSPQVVHGYGHVQQATSKLTSSGPLDPSRNLHLVIGLPLRDPDGLNRTLRELYDPASPRYRQWMQPHELAAKFCATAEDYQAVIDWAKAHGLNVTATHSNRICVEFEGPVAAIQKACHVNLRVYQHPTEPRTFFAPDAEPSLDLAVPVLTLDGLDSFDLPRPNCGIRPEPNPAGSGAATPSDGGATPSAGSAPGGAYAACDFRAAYVPGTTLRGLGQNVGLFQFDDFYDVDISNYETQFGLQSLSPTRVVVNGPMPAPGAGNANGEVCLDIEMVLSMSPGVSAIYVYQAPNLSVNWVPLLSRIQTDNLCEQVSCSWTGGVGNPSGENVFLLMAAQGQSFFNATGDADAFTGSIPFPSMSPNITEVGGTELVTAGACGNYTSETVWNLGGGTGSSGGYTNSVPIPWWQQGIDMTANLGSTLYRNVPDVALTADKVYVRYNNGGSGSFWGTSCAAPLWAGFMALVNEQASRSFRPGVGFLNPALYSLGESPAYNSYFHDTTVGNNQQSGSGLLYSAQVGYDLCTGWGTPAGQALINFLSGISPEVPNGGFETGDLSFWTQSGNTSSTGVDAGDAHSGNYGAYFGAVGSLGFISQDLTTVPGQSYVLSFWALNGGATNTEMYVYCNGTQLDMVNGPTFGWSNFQFTVTANYPTTFLEFGFRNDPNYFYLDDITFTALPGNGGVASGVPANGGFETGNTAYWTSVNGGIYTAAATNAPSYVHSGAFSEGLGTVNTNGTLSQTLATVPGQSYLLEFWLEHPFTYTPANQFHVFWNGSSLLDVTNWGDFGWNVFSYYVTASNSSTVLQFSYLDNPDYFYLDDVTVTPLAGNLLGQGAYVRSTIGEPWGANDNRTAMDRVFGAAAWNDARYETVNPALLFSPAVHFIFMEGSDNNANALNTFLASNRARMQAWVSNGGSLFINAAPNQGGNINLGFGVTLHYNGASVSGSHSAYAANLEHPVVNGPYLPVGTTWSGLWFAQASITGTGLSPILNGTNGIVLGELNAGLGHALFGGMTLPEWDSPQAQANNLRANILEYGNTAPQGMFEDLPTPASDGSPVPSGYRGLTWNNFFYLDGVHYSGNPSGYAPGAVSPNNCGYNASGNQASISSSSPFNLFSAWLTAAWNDNLTLEAKGYVSGVLAYDQVYTLSATTPRLVTFDMLGVTEVDFISSGGTAHYGSSSEQFVIDDMVIDAAPAAPAGVDHFAFSSITSPQVVNVGFPVTITAKDPANATASGFAAPVSLSGWTGTGSLIEGFESGTWPHSPWVITVVGTPGVIGAAYAHDGAYGLQDPEWAYRTDVSIGNGGDILSCWVRPSASPAGRAYLGFGASASGCWSIVVAANNPSSLIIQQNPGFTNYNNMATVSQTWILGHWYKLAVLFTSPSSVTCNLYDSDGRTLLNTVSCGSVTGLPGGIAMRSFSGFSLDTIRGGPMSPVAISPDVTGSFVNGVWSGNVEVFQPATDMVLFANDGFGGPGGASNPFTVGYVPPTLGPITPILGGVSLSWTTTAGGRYQVQYTPSLSPPITWNNLGSPITAGGTLLTINDTFSAPMRFYRIVLLP